MNRFCLDTSAYSRFKRGDPRVVELIDSAEWIGVPAIVIGELWVGFLAGRQKERNAAELYEFMAHRVVEELSVTHEVAILFAEILLALRLAGTPVPTNDVWIAACAAREGATVLTYDRHFAQIQRVSALILDT